MGALPGIGLSGSIIPLKGHEGRPEIVALIAAAQVHRPAEQALARAPAIAREYASSPALRLWGYLDAGELLGLAGIELTVEVTILRDLAVVDTARGRGIGRALIRFLQQQHRSIQGDTLASSAGFYEACGFAVHAEGALPSGAQVYRFSWVSEGSATPGAR